MPNQIRAKKSKSRTVTVKLKWPVDYKVKIKMLKHKIQNTYKSILKISS